MTKRGKKQAVIKRKKTKRISALEAKKRSEAAKKGWETRRRRAAARSLFEVLDSQTKVVTRLVFDSEEQLNQSKLLLGKLKELDLPKSMLDAQEQLIKKLETFYRNVAQHERMMSYLEQKERKRVFKDLAKEDPDSINYAIQYRMNEVWDQNPKLIPDLVRAIYEEMLELDLGEEYDETAIWDLYKEA